jgi:hypothetical protein
MASYSARNLLKYMNNTDADSVSYPTSLSTKVPFQYSPIKKYFNYLTPFLLCSTASYMLRLSHKKQRYGFSDCIYHAIHNNSHQGATSLRSRIEIDA